MVCLSFYLKCCEASPAPSEETCSWRGETTLHTVRTANHEQRLKHGCHFTTRLPNHWCLKNTKKKTKKEMNPKYSSNNCCLQVHSLRELWKQGILRLIKTGVVFHCVASSHISPLLVLCSTTGMMSELEKHLIRALLRFKSQSVNIVDQSDSGGV